MLDVNWEGGKKFSARTRTGQLIQLDGDTSLGVSPMEALLASLCGCMGIDVVLILGKMRADLQGLRVEAVADRNNVPPQYYKAIELKFFVKGGAEPAKIDKAIALSFETYCSVFHSLRPDLKVTTQVVRE